jgi:hypothetical protein
MRSHRDRAMSHLATEHGMSLTLSDGSPMAKSTSWTAEQGKNAWHLAADLVEQYAPLLWSRVNEIAAREIAHRCANDEAVQSSPEAPLAAPIVYLLDELPVFVRTRRSTNSGHQRNSWNLLVAVELVWHGTGDPFALPSREARLRLVRAYPTASEETWRLVLSELDTSPDDVISDCGSSILNALISHYGQAVGHVPSMFHVHRNIRAQLTKLPRAYEHRRPHRSYPVPGQAPQPAAARGDHRP